MKYGLKIKTTSIGGRLQHDVYEINVGPDRKGEVSNTVVEAMQKANEALWEEMPDGSGGLVSELHYTTRPRKRINY